MANCTYYFLVIVMITFGQSLNVFSVWWIGKARNPTWNLSAGAIVGIYVALVCVYGIMLFLSGVVISLASMKDTEALSEEIMGNVERADALWLEKQNKMYSVSLVAKVS